MQLDSKHIQEMKDLLEKEHGREFTWEEASDAAYRLSGIADIAFNSYLEECRRKKKLEEFPDGFLLEGGYSCTICGCGSSSGGIWYDKWGQKCMICQGGIRRKEIPASVAKNKESWYSKYDIESSFNVKGPTLRSWIKKGILKARTITNDGKGIHFQIFLIKDNKDTLPPKKMVESHVIKETKDEKEWFTMHPWYHFVDPKEHLKGYKIMDHLRVIPAEEMAEREAKKKQEPQ